MKIGIFSRLILNTIGSATPARLISIATVVPFLPRIFNTASSRDKSFTLFPSTDKIWSFGLIPIFSAGEPLIGDTIISLPSVLFTSAPIPSNSGSSDSLNCLAVSLSIYVE